MEFTIEEDNTRKTLTSSEYNYVYNKEFDIILRWGETKKDNPLFSPCGPETAVIDMSEITAELLAVTLPFLNSTGTMVRICGIHVPDDKRDMITRMVQDAHLVYKEFDYTNIGEYGLFSLYVDKHGNVSPADNVPPYGNVCSLDNLAVVWYSDIFKMYRYNKLIGA